MMMMNPNNSNENDTTTTNSNNNNNSPINEDKPQTNESNELEETSPNTTTTNNNNNKNDEKSSSLPSTKKKRSGRPGRSKRRRKAKARAILSLGGGDDNTTKTLSMQDEYHGGCPLDRRKSLPGVLKRRVDYSNSPERKKEEEEEGKGMDWNDCKMLKKQLGYIPGNAVCVAARQCHYSPLATTEKEKEVGKEPSVLMLYPLAIRGVYKGGKSDGRKFKSRKRGCVSSTTTAAARRTTNETQDGENVSTNKTNHNQKKEEEEENSKVETKKRDWRHTSTNSSSSFIIEPFPTIYWLTSPTLRFYISQLELSKTHNVRILEEKLMSSPQYLQQMKYAHARYARQRWGMLTLEDQEAVRGRGWYSALSGGDDDDDVGVVEKQEEKTKNYMCQHRGVAGIRKYNAIKCLHAHAAHYLADLAFLSMHYAKKKKKSEEKKKKVMENVAMYENVVGRWVMEAVEELMQQNVLIRPRVLCRNKDNDDDDDDENSGEDGDGGGVGGDKGQEVGDCNASENMDDK